MTRIYLSNSLQCGQDLTLDPVITHRLTHVLRLNNGDCFTVFNGNGGEFQAKIIALKKNSCEIKIGKFSDKNLESPLKIHLGQVISRGEKMDYTIQKATELGITTITPLFSEHCNVQLGLDRLRKRIEHWQITAITACEQCGRCLIPKIFPAQNLNDWLHSPLSLTRIMLNNCGIHSLKNIKLEQEITLLVGPEGGFSSEEITIAQKNNFISIKLGPRILRTETAALAAISALQILEGDW